MTETNQQEVLVQTIQDHRLLPGAGCILSNDAGKWFVTTPGRVYIRKSRVPLQVDCQKDGSGRGSETIESKFGSALLGNVVTAGIGLLVDVNSGAGFEYPATLTIVLQNNGASAAPESGTSGTARSIGSSGNGRPL